MITHDGPAYYPQITDYPQALKVLPVNGTCGMPKWGLDSWTTSTIDHVSTSTLSLADNGESSGQLIFYIAEWAGFKLLFTINHQWLITWSFCLDS